VKPKIVECYDCDKEINTAIDPFLFSRPCIIFTRYRCERCGKRHELLPLEFDEKWVNPTVQIELNKIVKKLDDAYAKYKKNPNFRNTYYLDGLLDITERLVKNLEKIKRAEKCKGEGSISMINPKAPESTKEILRKKPELGKIFGWEMDNKICKFTPKYKVGEIARVLVMSNPDKDTPKGFVPNNRIVREPEEITTETDVFYAEVEITGYYDEGYGCIILRVLYKRNDNSKFDEVGHHHCFHRNWFETEDKKKFIDTLFELPETVDFT